MKRILVVVPELSYSGSVFSSKRICKVLLEYGYDVDLWSYQQGAFEKEFFNMGIKPSIVDKTHVYGNEELLRNLYKYDLVIANTIIVYAVADIAKNIVPTIWYVREAQNLPWQFFASDIKRYYALKRAENIYAVSEYARDFICENYNKNVKVVHNCVDDEAKNYKKNKEKEDGIIRFLALGTIEERKAFDVYINAYLNLSKDERARCEIHFAGRLMDYAKSYYTELFDLIENESGIFYHGEIQEREKLLQLMADSDVIVVPSKDESCSLVALEATMMSKPLVISKNVGAKYIVTEENGWIFETDNVKSLTSVYKDVLVKREELVQMGHCSRKAYVKTSTYEAYRKNIYEMVVSNMTDDLDEFRKKRFYKIEKEEADRLLERVSKVLYEFPGADFLNNKKIAIYAAGAVGKAFFAWCKDRSQVVCWVDEKYDQLLKEGLRVEPVKSLIKVEVDYIYIAVYKKEIANEIIKQLIDMGLDKSKLIWTEPVMIVF